MDKQVFTAKDIAEMCDISVSTAYRIIKRMNEELDDAGYLTFRGRVSKAYFTEQMYGMKEDRKES